MAALRCFLAPRVRWHRRRLLATAILRLSTWRVCAARRSPFRVFAAHPPTSLSARSAAYCARAFCRARTFSRYSVAARALRADGYAISCLYQPAFIFWHARLFLAVPNVPRSARRVRRAPLLVGFVTT